MAEFRPGTGNDRYDEYEELERMQRAAILDRMRDLTMGPDSSLTHTNGIIQNYNLKKLSSLNKTQAGLVRAARFINGSFLSFRMHHDSSLLQTDFVFKRDERPTVATWRLRQQSTGLERATTAMSHTEDFFLRKSLTALVGQALSILEQEATDDVPWMHRYSPVEIASARFTSGTIHETRYIRPDQFKISPHNGEPYL